jgi:hypothetical protein
VPVPARGALAIIAALGVSALPTLALVPAHAEVAHVPRGSAHVHVRPGRTQTGVDFVLPRAAAITGRITENGGHAVYNAVVRVFTSSGRAVASTRTDGRGRFRAIGLPPAAPGYYVCASRHDDDAVAAHATGNLGRCAGSTGRYRGHRPTAGARLVPARRGVVTRAIALRLPRGGALSGTLRSAGAGHDLAGLVAVLFDSSGTRLRAHPAYGAYQFSGLPAGAYRVCFDATGRTTGGVYDAETGRYGTGFLDRCYGGARWDGGAVPARARPIQVRRGTHVRGISSSLTAAGALAGAVTAAGAPHRAIRHALVRVFRHGRRIAQVHTGPAGRYRVVALPAAGDYRVCAVRGHVAGLPYRYDLGRCVSRVRVRVHRTRPGVDLVERHGVQRFGAVSGTVRNAAGTPLRGVFVDVYDAGHRHRGTARTAADGSYVVRDLPVGRHLVCFNRTLGGEPNRYAAACYRGRPWAQVDLPTNGDLIRVRAGRLHSGVDAILSAGATITGRVRTGSQPLAETTVWLISAHHHVIDWRWTDAAGNYRFAGLADVPRGYLVCMSAPPFAAAGSTDTGLSGQCSRGLLWRRPLDPVSR